MPKFASTFKNLLSNKEKLFELSNTPLNDNCSAVLLKKLPEKLGDPEKFLIPCDFSELEECLALADLGANINLIPISVWKKLSHPELTLTHMTLELANRSDAYPVGVAEDVFVKVGKFHFPADFVVVDYDVDLRVPLILRRPFLRTARALIDVHGEELTIRVNDEDTTFNVGHTLRYSYRYDDESVNRIDVIDVTCEEYAQEIEAFLTSDLIPPGIDDADFDPEGDIFLLEKLLNDDPSSPLPPKEIHFEELKIIKSSIDDPPELELKDLPSHLEYAFLEGTNKLPVIIAKNIKDKEKARLLKVLKSHKRAIAWKISNIKGIDPEFCTHKILMEDDFKPTVQHQRRVNPKIHEVIKKEVIKLLDAGLIYPISDSPWLNDATHKDHFPLPVMDQMLERLARNKYYCFLDGFSEYFQILITRKTKKRLPLLALMGRLPTDVCLSDYVTLRARSKGIMVNNAKVDVMAKLPHPTSVKEAENLAADHLSRLENPYQGDLEKKEINETFPLETLGMISFHGDSSTPWFADIANYHAGNFVLMLKYGFTHRLSTPYHPQTSGQVEVLNRGLKSILKRTIGENRASWSDKLDDALWAFRTAFKSWCTPYKLVYGKACHLPIELEHKAYWTLKYCNLDLKSTGDHQKVQMNELNELWDQGYENSLIYKEKTKKIHDSKIKNLIFNIGDRVLLFNSRLKIFSGKLKTC
ncbi:reverse transcriptase domain-containing protein [Tanacetum coccineum]|uniref:Reverse transcriptase domain-containing protein n=1 Tax=Tanacetum coccineum TaxID=301880 RepID=A0ABQ4Y8W0_9ASTR